MKIITDQIILSTKGHTDIVDVTPEVESVLAESGLKDGTVIVFVCGSTAGVTTIEYEPGLLKDLPDVFEKIAPANRPYHHNETWGDGNGFSHVRAALLGCSVTIPFKDGKLMLGTWQQVVVIDFDNRSRQRKIIVQITGDV